MTNLIKSLVLTNKSIRCLIENNQFLLNVDQKLKKPEIKRLCLEIFDTSVVSVNTYNLPPKKRHTKMKRVFVKFAGPKGKDHPLENFLSEGLRLQNTKEPLSAKAEPLEILK